MGSSMHNRFFNRCAEDYAPAEVHKVAPYFIFCGSLVNPIIYGTMNPQFKDAFKKLFNCGRHGNDNSDQSHARVVAVVYIPGAMQVGR